jgi:hypothetical protein
VRAGKPTELRERATALKKPKQPRAFAAGAAVDFMLAAACVLLPALRDCLF